MRPGYGNTLVLENAGEANVAVHALDACGLGDLAEDICRRFLADELAGYVVLREDEADLALKAISTAAMFQVMPPKRKPLDWLPHSDFRHKMGLSAAAMDTLRAYRPTEIDTPFNDAVREYMERIGQLSLEHS